MGWKDIAHGVLNVAGFIPGVGAIADLANGAIYLSEGKYGEAALCAVAAIPGIGDSVALVSKGAKAAKALKGLSAAKKGAAVVKGLAGAGKNLLKTGIKSGKEILKLGKNIKFNKDFLKTSSKFLSSIPVVGDYFKLGKGVLKGLKSLKGLSFGEILSLLKGKGMKTWGKVKDGARSLKGKSPKELFGAFKNKCKEFFLFGKCFAEDTLVCTESGYLPMKEIKAGDAVYSRNEKTGETGFKRVEQVTKTQAHTLYTIELNGKTEITATAYHPFYIEERGWVNAINLRAGDQLSVPEGIALVTLIKKDRYEEPVTMYNFHVEDWVSYYVTELKVYVHNGKKCKGASEAKPKTKAEILAENKAKGRAFEIEKVNDLKKVANSVEEQITVVTKDGTKIRVDSMGYDKKTGELIIQEYKSSAKAPLTTNQELGFPQIKNSGGLVVGKGKGVFKGGFEIPPGTVIKVIRPQ